MDKLEEKIGYHFHNRELLRQAMTHSSYANEMGDSPCYERLEFLGDSILGAVTAEFLYRYEPALPEGRMTRLRAELVCESALHKTALRLELGTFMRLGRGEERTGGRERVSVLADMVESVIAAIYLDGGMDEARKFIMAQVLADAEITPAHRSADYKSELQEWVQKKNDRRIRYELLEATGPDHHKFFRYAVLVNDEVVGEGSGYSKKEAEQQAAGAALQVLRK